MRPLLNDHQKVALPGCPKVDTAREITRATSSYDKREVRKK
jgi:hypothetical protein